MEEIRKVSAWCSQVYLVFGLQVTFVSAVAVFMMVIKDIRSYIQDMNDVLFWAPMMVVMVVALLLLHGFYDLSPHNIYAQFAYLLTWGFALAVVACGHYPGFGVLIAPGVLCLGLGFLATSVVARWTIKWGYHAITMVSLTSILFQIICGRHAGQLDGHNMALLRILCNSLLVMVEVYLIWKTERALAAHGADQIWITTAHLLLASFGLPCIFPCQVLFVKLGSNIFESRSLEVGRREDHGTEYALHARGV